MKTDMERSMEASGKIPRIVQVMYFKDVPRPSANQQPEQSLPQVWEAQWQQFLKTLQHPHTGRGNLQLTEAVPWDDTKAFLSAFEQVAEACRWPRDEWVGRLLPALRGGMEQIYCRLDPRERGDYGKVKSALLRGDAMRTESKRQHFRQCCYQEFDGPRRIYGRLQDLCRQWLNPEHRTKEQILELIIQEQLLAMLPPEVQNWVRECGPKDCVEVVALAEDFLMGRRVAKMWEWPAPLQQMAVSSLEAEGPLTDATARQHYTGIRQNHEGEARLTSERMSTRNASFMLSSERREMSGAGLAEGMVNLRERSVALERSSWTAGNLDQKPLPWELGQGNYGNVSSSEGFLAPAPAAVSQPDQGVVVFSHITETGEAIPCILPENRILSEIKIESYEDDGSEAEGSFEVSTEDFPEAAPSSPRMSEESPRRKLRPRGPEGRKQAGFITLGTSMKVRGRKPALATNKKMKEKKHLCTECGHRTYYLSDMLRHMNCHDRRRPHRCSECGRTFTKLSSLETHKKIHVPVRRLKRGRKPLSRQGGGDQTTSKRGKRVAALPALTKPMKVHPGFGSHQCQDCGQIFRWISSLYRHWRIRGCRRNRTRRFGRGAVEEIRQRAPPGRVESKDGLAALLEKSPASFSRAPRACTVNPAFSKLRPRKPQEASVVKSSRGLGKKKHVCPDCGRKCAKLADLLEHVRIHTGEKPYECPNCDRTFRFSSNFLAHKRKCHVKRPAPSTTHAEHQVIHPGNETLCEVKQEDIKSEDEYGQWPEESPGAVSPEADEAGSALRVQSGELQGGGPEELAPSSGGPFAAKFQRFSNRLIHTRAHPGEKPYECDECGKTFRWAFSLSEHQKSHKSNQKEPGLAECDVILEDEEELIHILERNFQNGETKLGHSMRTLAEDSQDAASDISEDCEARAAPKLRPRARVREQQGESAQCLTTGLVKKSRYSQKEKKHKCTVCGRRTYYLSDLLRHMRIHTGEKPYKCLGCGKTFTQNSALLFHKRSYFCAGGSSSRKSLAKSIAAGKGERNPRGGGRTRKLAKLVKGRRSFTQKERPFKCEECGQGFTWSSNLCRHRKLHSNTSLVGSHKTAAGSSKPNKMMVENSPGARAALKRMGSTSAEITRGVASVTVVINDGKSKNQPGKKLTTGNLAAQVGGKSLYSKSKGVYRYTSGLVPSQKTPGEKKHHQCKVCKKVFAIKRHLVDHEHVHSGEKPYECDECGRRFAWKTKLYRHRKIHTNVKPYKCPECNKSFCRKDGLIVHLKSHRSSCSYKCMQCSRRFSEREQLFRHQRIHAGQHPYECEECGQGFFRRDFWLRHQEKHRGRK